MLRTATGLHHQKLHQVPVYHLVPALQLRHLVLALTDLLKKFPRTRCLLLSRSVPMAETLAPTSYTRIPTRDSKRALWKDEILGFVEKEQGEVVGSQMSEQINIEEGFSSLVLTCSYFSSASVSGTAIQNAF